MEPKAADRPYGGIGPGFTAAVLIAALIGLAGMLLERSPQEPAAHEPSQYIYAAVKAANGVELHYIRTDPGNVTLQAITSNVTETDFYGINGGFFYNGDLLSMAVVNGMPVKGDKLGAYGSGSDNAKLARGTLVWDPAIGKLSVQVIRQSNELILSDKTRNWAQGGVSMSLGNDAIWMEEALAQRIPFPEDKRLRSAVVFDGDNRLYLIVSSTKATLTDFRQAVLDNVGGGQLVDGVFLDGDGSSQLRCTEETLNGDNRMVFQMIRLLN